MKKQAELIGRFFHSMNPDGRLKWQGFVLSEPSPSVYLVQLFSWLDGRPTDQKIVEIAAMIGWSFYSSEEEWREAGDRAMEVSSRAN